MPEDNGFYVSSEHWLFYTSACIYRLIHMYLSAYQRACAVYYAMLTVERVLVLPWLGPDYPRQEEHPCMQLQSKQAYKQHCCCMLCCLMVACTAPAPVRHPTRELGRPVLEVTPMIPTDAHLSLAPMASERLALAAGSLRRARSSLTAWILPLVHWTSGASSRCL